jgi:hypothetical protein
MRQLGEIRIGHVVSGTSKTGKAYTRPAKLDKFRFTSPSREILASVAELYGGKVQPWTPANGGPSEFEVYSTVDRLPVLIPPRDAVSQWYELYAGSKCLRRCDGQVEQKSDQRCMCNPERRQCTITTRVNVMLRDVPALGQWLLVTKGYYAATELPPAAELLAQAGGYISGWLGMEEKSVVREEGPVRFMVPTLDVEITPAALMAGQVTGPAAVAGPERVAITGGRPDYAALAGLANTADTVLGVYRQAEKAGHLDDALKAALKARGEKLRAEEAAKATAVAPRTSTQPPPKPDADGVIDVEVVEETDDPSDLWFAVIAQAGKRGWSTSQAERDFAQWSPDGTMPGSAEAHELRAYLQHLKAS